MFFTTVSAREPPRVAPWLGDDSGEWWYWKVRAIRSLQTRKPKHWEANACYPADIDGLLQFYILSVRPVNLNVNLSNLAQSYPQVIDKQLTGEDVITMTVILFGMLCHH